MALSASTTLSATVQRVTDVFTNEEFIRHTSFTVGGELKSFEDQRPHHRRVHAPRPCAPCPRTACRTLRASWLAPR